MNWDVDVPGGASPIEKWTADWPDLLFGVIGLMILMGIILWAYRSMQHPRLYLAISPKDGAPTARWQAIVRYLVLTPIMVFLWLWAILIILTIAADNRSAQALALAAAVVVGAARVLAHISPEASHELGKTIPLAVLTIILLGGGVLNGDSGVNRWGELLAGIDENIDVVNTYYLFLVVLDVVITGLWVLRERVNWRSELPGSNRRRFTAKLVPLTNAWRSVRDFGKASTHKSKKHGEVTHHG